VDEVFGAGLAWTIGFAALVAIYALAVALRYGTETLEIFAVVVSGLAAIVLAEGFMNVVVKRFGYVLIGALIPLAVGIAAIHWDVSRWLHGWVAACALLVAFLLLAVLAVRVRKARGGRRAAQDEDRRRLSLQLAGLTLIMIALALQARIAVFDHPSSARAAAVAEQKTDRLDSKMLSVDGKPPAILTQLLLVEQELCRVEVRSPKIRAGAICASLKHSRHGP
jgi:hypothetical protein